MSGRVGFATFVVGLHGGVLLAGALWLGKQHNSWTWRQLLRQPATPRPHTP